MANYKTLYLVSKTEYDNFLNGTNSTKYQRQVNHLEVGDGGKVVIRNDDNYKFPKSVNKGSNGEDSRGDANNETGNSTLSSLSTTGVANRSLSSSSDGGGGGGGGEGGRGGD